jgi:hypothetical protein
MTAARTLLTTHDIDLFEAPDGSVKGYRGSELVGATWFGYGNHWWAQRVGEPLENVVSRHAGIRHFVGGCPDCVCGPLLCASDDTGNSCLGCGYCLNGCSAGECEVS